jgi:undecaprenyl-diphosphatase
VSTRTTADEHATRARHPAVLALPVLAAVLVVSVLTWQVTGGGALTRLDVTIRDGLAAYTAAHPGVWGAAKLAADLGTPTVAAVLLAVVAVVLSVERHTGSPVYRAAFALFLLAVCVLFMKGLIHRPGPDGGHPPGLNGFFPSGHTASALTCYGTILALLGAGRRRAVRAAFLAVLVVLGVVVGAGLLVCAYHWFSDVLASVAISFAILWLTFPPGHGASLRPGHSIGR